MDPERVGDDGQRRQQITSGVIHITAEAVSGERFALHTSEDAHNAGYVN